MRGTGEVSALYSGFSHLKNEYSTLIKRDDNRQQKGMRKGEKAERRIQQGQWDIIVLCWNLKEDKEPAVGHMEEMLLTGENSTSKGPEVQRSQPEP